MFHFIGMNMMLMMMHCGHFLPNMLPVCTIGYRAPGRAAGIQVCGKDRVEYGPGQKVPSKPDQRCQQTDRDQRVDLAMEQGLSPGEACLSHRSFSRVAASNRCIKNEVISEKVR